MSENMVNNIKLVLGVIRIILLIIMISVLFKITSSVNTDKVITTEVDKYMFNNGDIITVGDTYNYKNGTYSKYNEWNKFDCSGTNQFLGEECAISRVTTKIVVIGETNVINVEYAYSISFMITNDQITVFNSDDLHSRSDEFWFMVILDRIPYFSETIGN